MRHAEIKKNISKVCTIVSIAVLALSLRQTVLDAQGLTQSNKASTISAIRQILQQSLKEAEGIQDAMRRSHTLGTIAEYQAWSGDVVGALQTVKALEGDSSKGWVLQKGTVLHRIAEAQVKAGEIKAALQTAETMSESANHPKRNTLMEIAKAQATGGDVTGAMQTVSEIIKNPVSGDPVLSEIAQAQALRGDFVGALQTAAPVRHPASRAKVQLAIAAAQAKAGNFSEAVKTANSTRDQEKFFAFWIIVWEQAKAGDASGALQIVNLVPEGMVVWRASA